VLARRPLLRQLLRRALDALLSSIDYTCIGRAARLRSTWTAMLTCRAAFQHWLKLGVWDVRCTYPTSRVRGGSIDDRSKVPIQARLLLAPLASAAEYS